MTGALLVIDVQMNMFADAPGLHDGPGLLARLAALVARAREAGAPVVFVRNPGEAGDVVETGGDGWTLHPALGAIDEDVVVDTRPGDSLSGPVNEPGGGTLDAWLRARGATRLVVCGLQSEFAVAATARGALERGYALVLVADGHSTFDAEGAPATETIARVNDEFARHPGATLVPAADVRFT